MGMAVTWGPAGLAANEERDRSAAMPQRTIHVAPDSELGKVLRDARANGDDVVLGTGDGRFRLVGDATPPEIDDQKDELTPVVVQLLALQDAFAGIDLDDFRAELRRQRE